MNATSCTTIPQVIGSTDYTAIFASVGAAAGAAMLLIAGSQLGLFGSCCTGGAGAGKERRREGLDLESRFNDKSDTGMNSNGAVGKAEGNGGEGSGNSSKDPGK